MIKYPEEVNKDAYERQLSYFLNNAKGYENAKTQKETIKEDRHQESALPEIKGVS